MSDAPAKSRRSPSPRPAPRLGKNAHKSVRKNRAAIQPFFG
jgi:hypothetical protein